MQQVLIGIIVVLAVASYYFFSQNQILQANNAVLEGAVATQEETIKSIQADFELQTQQLQDLTVKSQAVKENLKTYLSQYRMLTDSVNIRNAFIVNIEVNFDIIPFRDQNANEVLLRCIDVVKDLMNVDRWQINQPITLSDISSALLATRGVQTVTNITIMNKDDASLGYSNISYNIQEATRNGIIYPSLDPMIFEVKYPDNDIKGRIATF